MQTAATITTATDCRYCGGHGFKGSEPCLRCAGTGDEPEWPEAEATHSLYEGEHVWTIAADEPAHIITQLAEALGDAWEADTSRGQADIWPLYQATRAYAASELQLAARRAGVLLSMVG